VAYARTLIDEAAAIRLPELFNRHHPAALDSITDRRGVSVVAFHSAVDEHSSRRDATAPSIFRWATSAAWAYERNADHEPLSETSPGDVHAFAASAATGEILCYSVLKASPDGPSGATLRTRERSLFPVERAHGWGVFNELRDLPHLGLARVRELGRFVKNQAIGRQQELSIRGPVEALACVVRLLTTGPLRQEIDALVGDFEENVLKRNFNYFHIPTAVVRGTTPREPETAYLHWRYLGRNVIPAATSQSDMVGSRPRLRVIEDALALPGVRAVAALLALKRDRYDRRSTLAPLEGLAA
jgi:hypothetical protein